MVTWVRRKILKPDCLAYMPASSFTSCVSLEIYLSSLCISVSLHVKLGR